MLLELIDRILEHADIVTIVKIRRISKQCYTKYIDRITQFYDKPIDVFKYRCTAYILYKNNKYYDITITSDAPIMKYQTINIKCNDLCVLIIFSNMRYFDLKSDNEGFVTTDTINTILKEYISDTIRQLIILQCYGSSYVTPKCFTQCQAKIDLNILTKFKDLGTLEIDTDLIDDAPDNVGIIGRFSNYIKTILVSKTRSKAFLIRDIMRNTKLHKICILRHTQTEHKRDIYIVHRELPDGYRVTGPGEHILF